MSYIYPGLCTTLWVMSILSHSTILCDTQTACLRNVSVSRCSMFTHVLYNYVITVRIEVQLGDDELASGY
jgi:hypothetical protein